MFCTYITFYHGNKLPPFYIGSTSVDKINSGYHGSVSSRDYKAIWDDEIKTNPHLFHTKIITYHDTRKSATLRENDLQHKLQVVTNPLYINRAFATPDGFSDIDKTGKNNGMYGSRRVGHLNPMYGRVHSEKSKQKMRKPKTVTHSKSEQFKQLMRSMYVGKSFEDRFGIDKALEMKANLKKPKTEDHKRKQSDIMKNKPKLTCPHCGKSMNAGNYARYHGDNCPVLKTPA